MASSSSMDSNSIQSTPPSQWIRKYDVFISFRGTDTRNTFVDHLYAHLTRKGIFAFKDDKKLQKGESISSQLEQAIKNSRVSIVVFSKDYAASSWCLDEMTTIAECREELKQTVFPVFYDVDPSHVRKTNGDYENAFILQTEKFKRSPGKVDRWKRAMTDLGKSVGWDVRNKPEFREIEVIVRKVIEILGHKFSGFADDLIGIQSHVAELESILKLNSKDDAFRVLGIWGMGGIGKTTLATVLYDRISYQFDACCFIHDVSKIYRDGGAIAVQKQILRQSLKEENLDTYSPFEISGIVSYRLLNIKILAVLDNVDHSEQLDELAIRPESLCSGSRIIITTRDKHILKAYEADSIYAAHFMNDDDAHKLLCRKAFKSHGSSSNFVELIPKILQYAQRLPLAIRVMGSFLCTRDAKEWRATLDRLQNNPDQKIMQVLKISFEGLEKDEKEIFLHIACFFKGEMEDYVRRVLDCCGLNPDIGIPLISEKSLITIRNQEIHMHDLLQDLGKLIVQQQFPKKPGSWSRLWLLQDFHRVLMTETGTDMVEAIVLDQKEDVSKCPPLRAEGLSMMTSLRLLILYHKSFSGRLNFLSNNLRYLLWHSYPFDSLPSKFEPRDLVELNMPNSSVQRLWEGSKDLPSLKRMDLSNSKYLMETPMFKGIPELERLDLTGCINLWHVHPSIGLLTKLVFLSLRNCSNLVCLDFGTSSNLISLRVLHLSGCTKLESTPDFAQVSNLEYLDIGQCTSLYTIHKSIGALAKLRFLSLRDCTSLVSIPDTVNMMTSLMTLDLSGCLKLMKLPLGRTFNFSSTMPLGRTFNFSSPLESLIHLDLGFCNLREVPDAIGELRCLERLNLEGNNFISVPSTMESLHSLAYLNFAHCHELQSLPVIPTESALSVGRYFTMTSESRNHRSGLYIFDCPKLADIFSRDFELFLQYQWWRLVSIWLARLIKVPRHFRCGFDIVIPWDGKINEVLIPDWFNHRFNGGKIIRIVNSDVNHNWIGFAFYVEFEVNISGSSESSSLPLPHPFYLSFESEYTEERFDMPLALKLDEIDGSKYFWIIYISREHCHFLETGAHITFKTHPGLMITEWGLSKLINQERMAFLNPVTNRPFFRSCPLFIDNVEESNSSNPKIQFPYNWLVTEEEEVEKFEAKAKENNLSNLGL